MTLISPSFKFNGNKDKAISLKAQALQFYNFVASTAELGGVPFVNKSITLPDGSIISIISRKDDIYGLRFGTINILGIGRNVNRIISNGYNIIVWPVSTSFLDGDSPIPRYGLEYIKDPDNSSRLDITKQIPNTVYGGNCYWDGKGVLSWEGPWGFHISPQFGINTYTSVTPGTLHYESNGYNAEFTAINSDGTLDLTPTPGQLAIKTYQRFSGYIATNGRVLAVAPGYTLIEGSAEILPIDPVTPLSTGYIYGCGISSSPDGTKFLIAIIRVSKFKDRLIYTPLNKDLITSSDWIIGEDIDYPNTSTLTYLPRQNVYSFSKDGKKIITIVDTLIVNAPLLYTLETSIVDMELVITNSNITISSLTFTPSSPFSYTENISHSFSGDIPPEVFDDLSQSLSISSSSSDFIGEKFIAASYKGDDKRVLSIKFSELSGISDSEEYTFNYSSEGNTLTGPPYSATVPEDSPWFVSSSPPRANGYGESTTTGSASGVAVDSRKFERCFYLNNIKTDITPLLSHQIFTRNGSSNIDSYALYSLFNNNPIFFPTDYVAAIFDNNDSEGFNSTSSIVTTTNTTSLLFVDLNNEKYVYKSIKTIDSQSQTETGELISDLGITISDFINTLVNHDNNIVTKIDTPNEVVSKDRVPVNTSGSSTTNFTTNIFYSSVINDTESYSTTTTSTFDYPFVNPPVTSFCKGIVDRDSNFVGQINYEYQDTTDTTDTDKFSSLPNNDKAIDLFNILESDYSISGSLAETADNTRKIFLIR